jgi:hypothetical protein
MSMVHSRRELPQAAAVAVSAVGVRPSVAAQSPGAASRIRDAPQT